MFQTKSSHAQLSIDSESRCVTIKFVISRNNKLYVRYMYTFMMVMRALEHIKQRPRFCQVFLLTMTTTTTIGTMCTASMLLTKLSSAKGNEKMKKERKKKRKKERRRREEREHGKRWGGSHGGHWFIFVLPRTSRVVHW